MACYDIVIGGKVVGKACGPRGRWVPCSVPGCRKERLYLCDFPLAGKKAGATCSRGLCENHRGGSCSATVENCGWRGVTVGRQCPACGEPIVEVDYCPAHAKMEVPRDPSARSGHPALPFEDEA